MSLPRSRRDVSEMPLRCEYRAGCWNAATGRRDGKLICDECNKAADSPPVKCPACDVELPEGDLHAQKEHMETNHPEVIQQRLEAAGFALENGTWRDTLVGPDS